MTVQLLERPQSPISLMKREHKVLLDTLAPEAQTRIRCCAARLISYFEHWKRWKHSHYPSVWIYQPLSDIRKDLMDEYSIHVIRDAIALLERLGFLSRRKNNRAINLRNGQDRTHQYLLHSDRIEKALERSFDHKTAETLVNSPFVNSDTPSFTDEISNVSSDTSNFTADKYTQIPYIDSFTDSCTLSEAREKNLACHKEKEEDGQKEGNQPSLFLQQEKIELLPQNKNLVKDKSSAPPQLKKHQNDMQVPERWEEFCEKLIEYARRESKASPAGWAKAVARDVLAELNAGRSHCYWADFVAGHAIGTAEHGEREWINPENGEPWPAFTQALTYKFQHGAATPNGKKTNAGGVKSAFDVQAEVNEVLRDPSLAAAYWSCLKSEIVYYEEVYNKQEARGVQSIHLPVYLRDHEVPSLEVAAQAMNHLSRADNQQALPPGSAEESAAPIDDEKPPIEELQKRLDCKLTNGVVRLALNTQRHWGYRLDETGLILPVEQPSVEFLESLLHSPATADRAQRLVERLGFVIDEDGHLWEF